MGLRCDCSVKPRPEMEVACNMVPMMAPPPPPPASTNDNNLNAVLNNEDVHVDENNTFVVQHNDASAKLDPQHHDQANGNIQNGNNQLPYCVNNNNNINNNINNNNNNNNNNGHIPIREE